MKRGPLGGTCWGQHVNVLLQGREEMRCVYLLTDVATGGLREPGTGVLIFIIPAFSTSKLSILISYIYLSG